MKVAQQWSRYGNIERDVGSLVVYKSHGVALEDFRGKGATFVFNQGVNTQRDIVTQAYPTDIGNGAHQVACLATTAAATGWAANGIEIDGCDLHQGANGSGWILDWDESYQAITGVTSSWQDDGSNFSPYFDDNTNVQYTTMSTVYPPA
ncbi:hypothetical protein [Rhodococcus sp. OK302]|uniref:hypothetical protein n=1 Tax=Rhodococcus sp. OK302 TaxID=1882769 RepID=UPI000B93AB94|nr:hypothetical protein [Rhodococcus sp. OK302]